MPFCRHPRSPWHASHSKDINAVASFSILADVVKNVGGDLVDVKTIVGPNGDTHVYEPTPDDAKSVKAAEVVFSMAWA